MNTNRMLGVLAFAAAALGCSSDGGIFGPGDLGSVRVINASRVPFSVYVDDVLRQPVLGVADVSTMNVYAGNHQVRILSETGAQATFSARALGGAMATNIVIGGQGSPLAASVLEDTGSVVPSGKSKLRVSHLAGGAQNIEIWRTQPDWSTPVHIMTPFVYGATSPYLQSDAGAWEVFVTAPRGTAKLATTGSISIPAGERRTVAILDSAGVLKLRVLSE